MAIRDSIGEVCPRVNIINVSPYIDANTVERLDYSLDFFIVDSGVTYKDK